MFWEILKASKGLPVIDQYAALWGKKIAEAGDWKVTEITGELPLKFLSDGSVLVDYKIYGTSEGAGVETENLFDFDEYTIGGNSFITKRLTLEPNTEYTMSSNAPRYNYGALFVLMAIGESASTATNGVYEGRPITKTTDASGDILVGLRDNGSGYDLSTYKTMLVKGSTAPTSYTPHGYKLPLTVESGAQSQDIPIYIGDSKLGEEEYVDYESGKVYKRTRNLFSTKLEQGTLGTIGEPMDSDFRVRTSDFIVLPSNSTLVLSSISVSSQVIIFVYDLNGTYLRTLIGEWSTLPITFTVSANEKIKIVFRNSNNTSITPESLPTVMITEGSTQPETYTPYLQPTDPPVSLPPIPSYKGENTISSTETLGEATVKGRIKEKPIVYGWHVDPSVSDPAQAVTYLQDAVGKTPAAMGSETFSYGDWENAFFMPKPCMLRSDGAVAYYLDPNDYTKKADGTASDVANASFDGNAMMEWPLIWYKFEAGAVDGEVTFHCSNKQVDDTYHCWCNYDCDDNIIDHFYTAIYNGTGTEKMRSLSGIQLTPANGNGSATGQQEVTRATANNTTSDIEWYTDVYSDRQLISALLILMSKCTDDQAAYGRGLVIGSQTAAESYITGTLNNKGLFYGVTANGNNAVKVFGMENWFGCKWRRTAGLVGGANSTYLYKLTYGTADGSTAKGYNSNGQGYLTANGVSRPANNNYVTKMGAGKHGLLPKETAAVSSSLYYGVYYYDGTGYALFGGSSVYGLSVGSLCVHLRRGLSISDWAIGASLSCKPAKKT